MTSIIEKVKEHSLNNPQKTAIICDGEKVSYAELYKYACGFASYLGKQGYKKGDRIIVKAFPTSHTIISYMGIHLAGCVNVPVEKTIGEDGIKEIYNQLDASLVIADEQTANGLKHIENTDILKLAEEYYDENAEFVLPDLLDMSDILFTTGTTGKSKGVIMLHRTLAACAENYIYGARATDELIYLIPVPINHANGIRKSYSTLYLGGTIALCDGFSNMKKFYDTLRDTKANFLLLPPSAVRLLLMMSAKELAKYADQIKSVHTSAAPFPEADKERLAEILPNADLRFGYGSSESGISAMLNYSKYPGKICCVGRPNIHSRIFIVDENRNEIKSSYENQGLIAIEGIAAMGGYYNAPEMTAEVYQNGIVYTNDLGYIDEDGFVYVLGRQGDVINVGGLKIAPTEVETIVLKFPGISECVCYGVEDKMTGMAPKLILVPDRRAQIDTKKLREFLSTQLEAFKIPKIIEIVEEIPKTSNGKVNRKILK